MAIKLYKVPNELKELVPRDADYVCQHLYDLIIEGEKLEPDEESPDTPVADIVMYGNDENMASALCNDCWDEYDDAITNRKHVDYESGSWGPQLKKPVYKN